MKGLVFTLPDKRYAILEWNRTRGIHETRIYGVPGGKRPFNCIAIVNEEVIPVCAHETLREENSLVLLYEREGKVRGIAIKDMPEIMDAGEVDLKEFARQNEILFVDF